MKIIFGLLLVVIFISCNDDKKSGGGAPNITNVENVNGNIPDSSQGVTLNRPLPVDSSYAKDSVPK